MYSELTKNNTRQNFIKKINISISFFLVVLAIVASAPRVFAVTYTWDGGGTTNNWSDCANWTSNICPGASDIALFDSTSLKDAVIDNGFSGSVAGVSVNSGYSGTITATRDLTVGSSNFSQAAGIWRQGTSSLTINYGSFTQSNGTYTADTGTTTITYDHNLSGGTFTASSTRVLLFTSQNTSSTLTCSGDLGARVNLNKTMYYGISYFTLSSGCRATTSAPISAGSNIINNGTLYLNGSLTLNTNTSYTNNGTTTGGSVPITVDADFTQSGSLSGVTTVTFNGQNSSSTLTCTGNFGPTISMSKTKYYGESYFLLASGCYATTTSTVSNGSYLTVNGILHLNADMTINYTSSIVNHGSITAENNVGISVDGDFNQLGYLYNVASTTFNGQNASSTLNCTGDFGPTISISKTKYYGDSFFLLGSGCNATTTATVNTGSHLTVNGTLHLNGNFSMYSYSTILNHGIITAESNVGVTLDGDFWQSGYISGIASTTFNGQNSSSTLSCNGDFGPTISISKTKYSADSFFLLTSGCNATTTATINTGSHLTVNGTLHLNGNFSMYSYSTIVNHGTITAENNVGLTLDGDFNQLGYLQNIASTTFNGQNSSSTLNCTGDFGPTININKSKNYGDSYFLLVSGCNATTTATVNTGSHLTVNGNLHLGASLALYSTSALINHGAISAESGVSVTVDSDLVQSGTLATNITSLIFSGQNISGTLRCTGDLGVPINITKTEWYGAPTFTIASGCNATTTGAVSTSGNVVVNGTLTLGGNLTEYYNFSVSGGTLRGNGYSVIFAGDTHSSTLTCTGDVGATIGVTKTGWAGHPGYFTLASGCFATTSAAVSTFTDFTINGDLGFGGNISTYGNFSVASGGLIHGNGYSIVIIGDNNSSTISCTGNLGATINSSQTGWAGYPGSLTLASGCNATTSGAMSAGTSIVNNGLLHLGGNVSLTSGGSYVNNATTTGSGYSISLEGNMNQSGYLDPGITQITFTGSNNVAALYCSGNLGIPINVTQTGWAGYPGTLTVGSGCNAVASGAINAATNLVVNGNLQLKGSITLTSSGVFTVNGTLKLIGSETIPLPTLGGTSTVEFIGTTTYSSLGGMSTFESVSFTGGGTYNITGNVTLKDNFSSTNDSHFNQTAGTFTLSGIDQIITGTSTFHNLTKTSTTSDILFFGAGQTQTLTGAIYLSGSTSPSLLIRSTATDTQYYLNVNGPNTLKYLSLRDADNTNVTAANCYPGCTNVNNNTNFTFNADTLAGKRHWDGGGGNNNWSTAANWTYDEVPATTETVVFDSTSVKNAYIDPSFGNTIGGIVMYTGYSGVLSASSTLIISTEGLVVTQGTFLASSGTTTITGGFAHTGGTFSHNNGTVVFVGDSTLQASSTTSFYNVEFSPTTVQPSAQEYYKLDETSAGTTVVDTQGNYNGTPGGTGGANNYPQPTTTLPTLGFNNPRALNFDGTDDYVGFGAKLFNGLATGTYAAWFKMGSANSANLIYEDGSGFDNFAAFLPSSVSSVMTFHLGSNTNRNTTKSSWNLNQWYHIAITWGSQIKIYVNGALDNTIAVSGGSASGRGGQNTQLGRYYWGPSGGYFNGTMDDVRIYTSALSDDQVAQLASGNEYLAATDTTTTLASSTLNVVNSLVIDRNAALDTSSSNCSGESCAIAVSGNWTNNGHFTARTSTTTFNGSGTQVATGTMTGVSAFYNLEISNTSATTTIAAHASTTHNFYVYGANTRIAFGAGANASIENFLVAGTSGNEVYLFSSTPGSQWHLYASGTRDVSYVKVKDSDACGFSPNVTAVTSINSGNNTCWTFASPASITLLHYRWRMDHENEVSAGYYGGEDTILNNRVYLGDRVRLRYVLQNDGGSSAQYNYQLEYASSSCTTWVPLSPYTEWYPDFSQYVPQISSTTNSNGLTDPGGYSFISGVMRSGSAQTGTFPLGISQFTEHEFVLNSTASANVGTTYCFRLTNAGSASTFIYSVQPQLQLRGTARPQAGGSSIESSATGTLRVGGTQSGGSGGEGSSSGSGKVGGGQGGGGGDAG